jgi:hypothetical protein
MTTPTDDGFFETPSTLEKVDHIQEEKRKAGLLKRLKDLEAEILENSEDPIAESDKEEVKRHLLRG